MNICKKRILFLMPALPGGGAEKVLIDILRHFDYSRFDVSLFLEYKDGIYVSDIPDNVHLKTLHGKNNLWFQRFHRILTERGWFVPYHELVYRKMFLWLFRNEEFDTIVSFMEGCSVKFHSYILEKARINISWVHIDLQHKHWTLDYFRNEKEEKSCYEKMDRIIFVSYDARKAFKNLYGIADDKCAVHYNLIDVESIRVLSTRSQPVKNKFTICMIGRMNRQKRYDRAIEVAKMLKKRGYDFELWILGDGELRTEIESQIIQSDLQNNVQLKGFVKPPYSYLAQSDILLNTSESEGLPLVLAEAFSLGVPVISTNVTGPRELLGDSEYGILTEQNAEDIFRAVKLMIDNVVLRNYYAEQSRLRSGIFQVEASMNELYELL
ncbi:MAG: glycosyltransferase [Candidatus Cryptobacteroides sp.]